MIHKSNLYNTIDYLKDRNKSDYSKIRKERIDGEYRKKVKKEEDLKEKHVKLNLFLGLLDKFQFK